MNSWREEFLAQSSPKDPESFPFVLVGNKIDKESERKVLHFNFSKVFKITSTKAAQWSKENGQIPYFETSAKDQTNVSEAFEEVARNALKTQNAQM